MKVSHVFLAAVAACCSLTAFAAEPQCKQGCICKEEGTADVSALNPSFKEGVEESERIFEAVEQLPSFPGGAKALNYWLSMNLRYPELAQQNNVEGRVVVQFVIEKDGSISHPVVVRGADKDLDREAIRVVKAMPLWVPARNNGEVVRSKFTLPVIFRLRNETIKDEGAAVQHNNNNL